MKKMQKKTHIAFFSPSQKCKETQMKWKISGSSETDLPVSLYEFAYDLLGLRSLFSISKV